MRKLYVSNSPVTRLIMAVPLLINLLIISASTQPSREYQLKAVFLFNFTQFVEWPANSFSSDQAPMVIGIVGSNPFGSYLEETVHGEKINGRALLIRYYDTMEDIGACHVLFINVTETNKREQIIEKVKDRNILTVSDAPDFMQQGGMIRFFTKQDKIKLQVNLEATKMASLVMSSKLLRLVEVVKSR
ncbi:YfiR family protein [Terrimonas pollutisoli]|uniref:YfiR family protein n=1 Tax=Terrimonas pollutisoli TaxID=3034147 RepID=UPI0023EB6791|nr:YfiR family protein [Terrimonas sp. H1YJ31]